MHAQIRLTVAIEIKRAQRNWTRNRLFENSRVDGLALVNSETRARNVERDELQVSSKFGGRSLSVELSMLQIVEKVRHHFPFWNSRDGKNILPMFAHVSLLL
jgi:hypothetical protein